MSFTGNTDNFHANKGDGKSVDTSMSRGGARHHEEVSSMTGVPKWDCSSVSLARDM